MYRGSEDLGNKDMWELVIAVWLYWEIVKSLHVDSKP